MAEHTREDAYRLGSPAAHRSYYDAWSATYDDDFIAAKGYLVPAAVARAFTAAAAATDTPVADVGCGTGQLGRLLQRPDVDGFDISPGMLAAAARTGTYRTLHQSDLTASSSALAGRYGGLVSSGTFTHGHLGPPELVSTMRLCRPGALCAIGINADHYRRAGFDFALADLREGGRIVLIDEADVPSYPKTTEHDTDDAVNRTVIVTFRLTG